MTDPENHPEGGADDPVLAGLTEQITRRLQAGEEVDADDYAALHPACDGPLRSLLPTLHSLVELGRSVECRPRQRPAGSKRGEDTRS